MKADAWWPNRLNTFFALARLQVTGTNSISQMLAGYHVTVLKVSWVKIRVETYQLLDNGFVVFFYREERLGFILHHVSLPCFNLQGMVRGFLKQQPVHWFTSQIVAALGYCRHYVFTLTWLVKNRSDKMIKDAELSEEQTRSRPFRAHAWLKTQQVSNTHSSTEKNGKIWSPISCWSIIILLLEILGCYSLDPHPLNLAFWGGTLLYVTYIFRGVFRGGLIVT